MSSETACFNGYAEEILGVQMADALFFDAIFTAGAGTRYGRGINGTRYKAALPFQHEM